MKAEADGVAIAVHGQPPGSGVAEQNQGHDQAVEGQGDGQCFVGDVGSVMQGHVGSSHRDGHEAVVEVGGTEEVAGCSLILKRAMRATVVHCDERFEERPHSAARTAQCQGSADKRPVAGLCQFDSPSLSSVSIRGESERYSVTGM